jgi:hypothetical protein
MNKILTREQWNELDEQFRKTPVTLMRKVYSESIYG